MAAYLRRGCLAGLVGMVILSSGCNLIALPYFLLFGYDDRYPPECDKFDNPKEEVKVVLAASVGPETRSEFMRADRDVCELLARYLTKQYKESKTKVVIVPPYQVENYKDKHPNWQCDLIALGNAFHANYVINLDLDKMSLYPPGNTNTELLQGQADVAIKVLDVHDSEESPVVFNKSWHFTYPPTGPEDRFDTPNPMQFRDKFLSHMVKDLSHFFASYTMDQKNAVGD